MKKNLNLPKKKTGRLRNLFLTVCLLASVAASAQEKTVSGTVTDALGDPLIGATVLVQGTSNGVITDIDGRYSIQATPENTLDFSYVGMVKQAVKVGSQSVINVQMKDDSQMPRSETLRAPSPTLKATKSPTSRWSTPYPHCKERLPACR